MWSIGLIDSGRCRGKDVCALFLLPSRRLIVRSFTVCAVQDDGLDLRATPLRTVARTSAPTSAAVGHDDFHADFLECELIVNQPQEFDCALIRHVIAA